MNSLDQKTSTSLPAPSTAGRWINLHRAVTAWPGSGFPRVVSRPRGTASSSSSPTRTVQQCRSNILPIVLLLRVQDVGQLRLSRYSAIRRNASAGSSNMHDRPARWKRRKPWRVIIYWGGRGTGSCGSRNAGLYVNDLRQMT